MKDNFFITTPIYYTNWLPHIWHAYSSIIADSIARFKKISSKNIKFSTWVDENSQKSLDKANELWMDINDYLDMMAWKHKKVWDWLDIKYSDFVRTTKKEHHEFVFLVLQKSFDNWDIYEWIYEWMYCVWCEAYKKEEDLVFLNKTTKKIFPISKDIKLSENIIKVCPDHLKSPDIINEKNYFFRLSKYQDKLLDIYEKNKNFVIPNDRFNEVISFVKRWLDDFSISRQKNTIWIKLPFDKSQFTYVWYDALFNYLSICQNWDEKFWPADLHIVWKDILRFHAIYWPAMLLSVWYEIPKQILSTWFLTIDWQKISKSLWNSIDPLEFIKTYSKDLFVLYLLYSFNIWQDWDFNTKQAILIYNAKLANNLWNLLNRIMVLAIQFNQVLDLKENINLKNENELLNYIINDYNIEFDKNLNNFDLKQALELSFIVLDKLNKFLDSNQLWNIIKDKNRISDTKNFLYILIEWLRLVSLNLYVFFPKKMEELFINIWFYNYSKDLEDWKLNFLRQKDEIFVIKDKKDILYTRF